MDIRKILVGIDFSPYSEVARKRAFDLALSTGARLILHHSCEDVDYLGQRSWLRKGSNFEQLLESGLLAARQQLDALAEQGRAQGLVITTEISEQNPDKAIVEAVAGQDVDLVVIGTHGRTGLKRLSLARIAERIVRNSPCSVLVARPAPETVRNLGRLLVPTDFSEAANLALKAACSLAPDDGRIDVLHCWLTYFYSTGYDGLYEESVALEPEMGDSIRRQGAALVESFRDPRLHLSFEEQYTSPVQGICDTLEARAYDMVVMGSHSRHGFKRFFLGSTAEAVVRHANSSVLVVRQKQ